MNRVDSGFRFIGKPVPRHEDERLVTGAASSATISCSTARPMRRWCARPIRMRASCASTKPAPYAMPGVLGVFTGADCLADRPQADPARSAAEDQIRHEAAPGPAAAAVFIGPHMLLPADKARHVGEAVAMVVAETALPGTRRRRSGRGRLRGTARSSSIPKRRCSPARRRSGTRCRTTSWSTRISATRRRPTRRSRRPTHVVRHGLPYRPRHRRADGAARGAWRIMTRRAAATRSMPAAAARCGRSASWPRCSASKPDRLRVLSFDVGGNFGTRNRVFVEFGLVLVGGAASSAGR